MRSKAGPASKELQNNKDCDKFLDNEDYGVVGMWLFSLFISSNSRTFLRNEFMKFVPTVLMFKPCPARN